MAQQKRRINTVGPRIRKSSSNRHYVRDNRGGLLFLFALYALIMLWIMFLYRTQGTISLINLEPMHTIKHFTKMFLNGNYSQRAAAAVNLFGNVIMFMPLGVFLPGLWKKQNKFILFFITVTVLITALEAAQYFSMLGTADIDDLILNDIGAVMGFIIYRVIRSR